MFAISFGDSVCLYFSDGHVLVRHPDWETAYRMSFAAANNIRLFAE